MIAFLLKFGVSMGVSPVEKSAEKSAEKDRETLWLEKISKGDERAFGDLVETYMQRAYGRAYRILLNKEDAEDAVQQSFTKLWQNAARFDAKKASISTWLQTIVTRTCLDRLRQKRGFFDSIEFYADKLKSREALIEDVLVKSEEDFALKSALLSLRPMQRAAISLCYYEGLSNAQAAKQLNLSLKALESQLGRARQALREKLNLAANNDGGLHEK